MCESLGTVVHKLIAVAIVMILAFNVTASEQGGFNEETPVEGTDITSIDYHHQASAGELFGINVELTENAQNNTTNINWVTQICINSGICYPPETNPLEYRENGMWNGSITPGDHVTYVNWRIDLIDSNENVTKVPENGFGWKVWSDCWYDGSDWGGNDSSCQEDNDDNVPGFIAPLTLAAIGTAGLMARRD